jgi:Rps23 Pro-64 3,4-dihydroxylase Tpa1-like proline 4-hydroxylase
MKVDPAIDFAAVQAALSDHGFAQVKGFLAAEDADRLHAELDAISDWDLAVTTDHGPASLTAAEMASMDRARRGQLMESIRRQSRAGFSFAYHRRNVLPGENPVADGFADWIATPAFIHLMQQITGDDRIVRADAHASMYREGSFLRGHDDTYTGKTRLYAYVLNLSRDWEADWGGLLHFEDEHRISGCLVPEFNTLNIFRVPRMHFVSQVATYARRKRLTITGWLFAE